MAMLRPSNIQTLLTVFLTALVSLAGQAQPVCTAAFYDEQSGLAHWRVTQMLQTDDGMMWFSTWNGLDRFDGCEFANFKAQAGKGTNMPNDRMRDIRLTPEGEICCQVDDEWFLFSRRNGQFSKAPREVYEQFSGNVKGRRSRGSIHKSVSYSDRNGYRWLLDQRGHLFYCKDDTTQWLPYPIDCELAGAKAYMSDKQGNLWLILQNGVCRLSFGKLSAEPLPQDKPSQVRCAIVDSRQRYWVATRDDATLRLFDCNNQLLGYLTPQGRLTKTYSSFGSPIYCMLQQTDSTILLGSKPDGLLRLKETADATFTVERLRGVLPCDSVYDLKQDRYGRVWVATLGGGIALLNAPKASRKKPSAAGSKVRFLHITRNDIMLAATTEGLLVGCLPAGDSVPQLRLHQREANREGSLGCNATMDILETADNRLFVSTESGGISEILSSDLTAPQLEFRNYNRQNGLNSDVVLSLAEIGGQVFAVSSNQLLTLSPDSMGVHSGFYDQGFFHRPYRFSEMHPCRLPDGRWLFGLMNGSVAISPEKMAKSTEAPFIALTGIDRHRQGMEYVASSQDTIVLQPGERDLTVCFATLDYCSPTTISYAFRMDGDPAWRYIAHSRTTTLARLKPGTYHLQLRSTNADGVWVQNIRTLTIIVEPTFWEAWYGQLLMVLIVLLLLAASLYTWFYIRRMHRQQQETLQAYLALMETKNEAGTASAKKEPVKTLPSSDQAFMDRVMQYVEEHIADTDANIDAMAEAAATSRSGLFRKMKGIVGLTPADFLREARIKRACLLLTATQIPVADIAYRCGFNDPKYFGKCFKASTGCSPTEYRSTNEG